ncbi:MAG TPA: Glu/Leu/Phe/Val dehydrogenase dimerization domain-containing protein [Steroidobacteraceae bacterium]|jgi:leucine dehydrogenase|nr:Glu/Leu/Phe/Val dehydrogenase dimerization domain-containing protein [Steroidobacteraceae bacterium]
MEIFDMREFDAHELVLFGHDAATGLRAIIAVHSTALGPAAGGCRMWPYASTREAVADVLRLSRGMSYKNAMAGLKFGGGKAVIIGDSRQDKTPELFGAFGRLVDSLNGRYVTAEDVGTTTADMAQVERVTRFVAGLGRAPGEAGGDPGPKTALGVFLGIKAAVRFKLGRTDLEGVSVAVQGAGGVGYHLCGLLAAEGARLSVADVRPATVARVVDEHRARAVSPEHVLTEDVDVLAPCALGAVLDAQSIPRLRARIVAGAANNQLAHGEDGGTLLSAGILYAPDYVINAGGIISVAHEYYGGATEAHVLADIQGIPVRLTEIFERARRENRATNLVADEMARERLARPGAHLAA